MFVRRSSGALGFVRRSNNKISASCCAYKQPQHLLRYKSSKSSSTAATTATTGVASNFPGAKDAPFTTDLEFKNSIGYVIPVFHIMDNDGNIINQQYFEAARKDLTDEKLVGIYKTMVKLETMDEILYNAQRQGRVSFYMTNYGEESIQIGSAAALESTDEIYAQYREAGVLMHRGFTLEEFMHQCFSTKWDHGKGRQMPVHYGSKELRFQTISSPLATQIPQAAGVGYTLRLSKRDDICMCYFGEGAASEGDFHAALNMASTLGCQTVFLCRNNGFAISTPTSDQYRGDGIAARGLGYGIHTIRVDGNDLFAMYLATKEARRLSIEKKVPVLIEAMTYRVGHHSTSDDSTRYRSNEELQFWKDQHNPINRFRRYLEANNLWNEDLEKESREANRKEILELLNKTEKLEKPGMETLITDVYDDVPDTLQEQFEFVENMVKKYPEAYEASSH